MRELNLQQCKIRADVAFYYYKNHLGRLGTGVYSFVGGEISPAISRVIFDRIDKDVILRMHRR